MERGAVESDMAGVFEGTEAEELRRGDGSCVGPQCEGP